MPPVPRPVLIRTHRPAFTLIELLVVIGIIGLLTGILLPALSRARKSALKVACQSNMRDVGIHLQAYSNQWKGWMFPPRRGAGSPEEERWTVFVFDRGQWNPQVLKCPADDPNPVNDHSYILNDNLTLHAIKHNTTHTDAGLTASEVIMMGEKATEAVDYYMNPEWSDYVGKVEYYRHGARWGSNYLFLDGHVETCMPVQANYAIDPWDPTKPIPKPTGEP